MERRQTTVQPGITEQGWESIHALQQRWVALDQCCILGSSAQANLLQGCFQGLGSQFGGAAATGHRRLGVHGSGAAEPLHEALIDVAFPLPQKR